MPEASPSLGEFFAAWDLFRLPSTAGAIAGGTLGFLGVFVVLRRLVFLSAAVSQASGLGVALAFYLQLHFSVSEHLASPTVIAFLMTLLAIVPFTLIRSNNGNSSSSSGSGLSTDSLLGVVFLLGSAGTLAVGTRIVQELQDIESLLFGSAVAVLDEQFRILVIVASALALVHVWWWRGFTIASFDAIAGRVRGLPVRFLDFVLFASLALAISVSTRALGALPTFGFTVLPAMAAIRLAPNIPWSLLLATFFGAASGFVGYVVAYLFELPVGASQVLVAAGFAGISLGASALLSRLRNPKH